MDKSLSLTCSTPRLCRRVKLPRDHMSGSFQFNSGEEKQALYGSERTTCSLEEEPQYAEIAEVHPSPKEVNTWVTLPHSSPFHTSTMETTLPSLGASTLPSRGDQGLPPLPLDADPGEQDENASLLSSNLEATEITQISRLSMSETSLTDEIMLALKDKLNDPSLYMSVLDCKAGVGSPTPASPLKEVVQEELYCSPLYSDPLQLQ